MSPPDRDGTCFDRGSPMLASTRSAFLLLALTASATAISAQQPTPQLDPQRIALDVVVTPKSGAPVAGLQQSDFTVLDNKTAQPIANFNALGGSQAPVQLLLVIDAVNAPFRAISYERGQIDAFLRANGGHLPHPLSIAIFTDTGIQAEQGSSTDGNALATSLDQATIGLRDIRRDSGFYGAEDRLSLSLNALRALAARESASPGRKLVLFVSPGWPILSGPEVDLDSKQQQQIYADVMQISGLFRRDHITLYSVDPIGAAEGVGHMFYYEEFLKGVSKPSQAQIGNLAIQVLAVQTGGLALAGSNDISGLLGRCMADATAYYEISFPAPPSERPGEYHQLEIKVDKPGLIARTRTGYYSQP
jgi:VWFA-related protein